MICISAKGRLLFCFAFIIVAACYFSKRKRIQKTDGVLLTQLLNDRSKADSESRERISDFRQNVASRPKQVDKKQKAKGKLNDFEAFAIAVPIRLHHVTGHPVSHGRHFLKRSQEKEQDNSGVRRKRDLHPENEEKKFPFSNDQQRQNLASFESENDELFQRNFANYSLSVFGLRLSLHLTPFDNFLAPNYSLRFIENVQDNKIHPDVPRHCFYSGYVNGNRGHKAVLSLCKGMFGAFHTDDSDYLIQPKTVSSNLIHDDANDQDTKPHQIFRRSTRRVSSRKKLTCGYIDSDDRVADGQASLNADASLDQLLHTFDSTSHLESASLNKDEISSSGEMRNRNKYGIKQESSEKTSPPTTGDVRTSQNKEKRIRSTRSGEDVLRRRKRHLSLPRNVETMVTVDRLLVDSHDDVEHYVLTLMAIVHHIFLDPTIENMINIVVVELVVVGDSQAENGPHIVKNAHTCLRNFCQWQFEHNNMDDSHPTHHDTAVLITGQDICRTETACDTLGLAELGTMCDLRRSCSINEDNGLSTAFTIAHEIGHLFNAPHDNSEKCLNTGGRQMKVMSPTLDNNAHPWSWSRCSAKFITEYLDNHKGECLLDVPPLRLLPLPVEDPGQMFDANDQCSFIYGPGSTHCNFMFRNTCKRLWCVSKEVRHGCRTPHLPWADGTSCGNGMWCHKGACVPIDRNRLPVDGSWGTWGQFGGCSRSCGGGVQAAERMCDNPRPMNGGAFCTGRRRKFNSCNTQPCPIETDFRAEQCAAFNDWTRFHRKRIQGIPIESQWVPKYDGILEKDRCKLTCRAKVRGRLTTAWYVLRTRVVDGTPCSPGSDDICVEGTCEKAGCDHVIGSRASRDSCGLCQGDNSSCRLVRGHYNIGHRIGYNQVAVIPAGATNVVISQQSHTSDANDNNFLVLREKRGNYVLNGHRSVSKSKQELRRRGSGKSGRYLYDCDYTGTDALLEVINCTRALQVDLVVEVLSAGNLMPPNINYHYYVPLRNDEIYRWQAFGPWSTCSAICNGKSKRKIYCLSSTDRIVPEKKCSFQRKPNTSIRLCNTDCSLKWYAEPGKCSARCGSGIMRRDYRCRKVKNRTNNNGPNDNDAVNEHLVEQVSDEECPQRKPNPVSVCRGDCLPTRWHYGSWSACSVTCGGGIQARNRSCQASNGDHLDASECGANNSSLTRQCATGPCPQWASSAFSRCSASCGSGVQSRRVWCASGSDVRPNDECDVTSKPLVSVGCNAHDCPKWSFERWSQCSATCGKGSRSRIFRCVDHNGRVVDPSFCVGSKPPTDTRPCSSSRHCNTHSWGPSYSDNSPFVVMRDLAKMGPFPKPETTIATVASIRTPSTTAKIVPLSSTTTNGYILPLSNSDTYANVVVVNTNRVTAVWRTGSWTPCSATCGAGIRLRYVSCRHKVDRREVSDEACGPKSRRPASTESCQIGPCPVQRRTKPWTEENSSVPTEVTSPEVTEANDDNRRRDGSWRTGTWTQCSSSCGEGIQKRAVICQNAIGHSASCDSSARPNHVRECVARKCAAWRAGSWGKCSKPCNNGTRSRAVHCVTDDGTTVDVRHCDITQYPTDVRPCNIRKCRKRYHWSRGEWSPCSHTCGRGLKTRQVHCVDRKGNLMNDALCANLRRPKPRDIRRCRVQRRCPKWRAGKWSDCSTSCGTGVQTRRVRCKYKRKKIVDFLCDERQRPDDVRACNVTPCSTHRWSVGEWGACSAPCGEGVKVRSITCQSGGDGRPVARSHCENSPQPMPPNVTQCVSAPCTMFWFTAPWSECSSTCGSGLQRRKVTCVHVDPVNYTLLDADNCDVTEKPDDVRDCNRGGCRAPVFWRVGSWSDCSSSCGSGSSVRKVVCSNRRTLQTLPDFKCAALPSFRPDRLRQCHGPPCLPRSCLQLQQQHKMKTDRNYLINVKGTLLKIFCKGMNSSSPLEYVTLPSGSDENYSEIFGLRLLNPNTCPANGTRPRHCVCHRDHPDEGYTWYHKVRIDLVSMRLLGNDFTFATTKYGKPVLFGTAGDCYSRVACPQGSFRINLAGTGLVLSNNTEWLSYGINSSRRVFKSREGEVAEGKCGGYCSRCQPNPNKGLQVDHKPR